TNLRVLCAAASGGVSGPESSMLKIRGSEIAQEIASLERRANGATARAFRPVCLNEHDVETTDASPPISTAAARYFNFRKISIYGGSNEVQKNIISKTILGL